MKSYNLPEYVKYHPYHINTFAGFANVTLELMEAVVNGTEELTEIELMQIARYTNIPFSVLTCPKEIMLDKSSRKHQQMISELEQKLYEIQEYQKKGLRYAELYMRYRRADCVNLELDFINGYPVSFSRYLGVKEQMDQVISFCAYTPPEPRGLRKRGATV